VRPDEDLNRSLPVWAIHVSLYFYPEQQAWYSHAMVTEQRADHVTLHQERELEWGPFDSAGDALGWSHARLEAAMGLSAAPWGSVTPD